MSSVGRGSRTKLELLRLGNWPLRGYRSVIDTVHQRFLPRISAGRHRHFRGDCSFVVRFLLVERLLLGPFAVTRSKHGLASAVGKFRFLSNAVLRLGHMRFPMRGSVRFFR